MMLQSSASTCTFLVLILMSLASSAESIILERNHQNVNDGEMVYLEDDMEDEKLSPLNNLRKAVGEHRHLEGQAPKSKIISKGADDTEDRYIRSSARSSSNGEIDISRGTYLAASKAKSANAAKPSKKSKDREDAEDQVLSSVQTSAPSISPEPTGSNMPSKMPSISPQPTDSKMPSREPSPKPSPGPSDMPSDMPSTEIEGECASRVYEMKNMGPKGICWGEANTKAPLYGFTTGSDCGLGLKISSPDEYGFDPFCCSCCCNIEADQPQCVSQSVCVKAQKGNSRMRMLEHVEDEDVPGFLLW